MKHKIMKHKKLSDMTGSTFDFDDEPAFSKIKVFAVDDELKYLDHIKNGLEETGKFEVTTSQSPSVALIQIQNTPPDFLILDINMPHIDGGEFLCRLLHQPHTGLCYGYRLD